jgi:hypothetical protein
MAHTSLRNHNKLKDLAEFLDIPEAHAVGLLECLWWAVYDTPAIDQYGIMDGWADRHIARQAGWTGDVQTFIDALERSGFIERTQGASFAIHDYADWAPTYLKKRWQRAGWDGEKPVLAPPGPMCSDNGSQRQPMESNGSQWNPVASYLTEPNRTEPDLTQRNRTKPNGSKEPETEPEISQKDLTGSGRNSRGFISALTLRLCVAFGLQGDAALRQRNSFEAVARRIAKRPDAAKCADALVSMAEEKREAGLRHPVAAWQKIVNKEYPKGDRRVSPDQETNDGK